MHRNEIIRLKIYRQELADKYLEALTHRNLTRARELFDLRRRVLRAVLLRQEWSTGDPIRSAEHVPLSWIGLHRSG
ncbi:MAG TPA: hypothetical protein VMP10_01480 [Chloroflexota bacterium]|nr:hypothetical protein [Chloroflexota bacterium]